MALEGPSKILPGGEMTLVLTLDATDDIEDGTLEVRVLFGRADESKSMLNVWVDVLTPRAEPELSTACIRYRKNIIFLLYLKQITLPVA